MILLINNNVIELQKEIVKNHKLYSSTLLSQNKLLIIGDYSFKTPKEFKNVFRSLGITEKEECNEKKLEEIHTKEGIVNITPIKLSNKFNKNTIKFVSNILSAMFDGYEVENYIDTLKKEFENRLNK